MPEVERLRLGDMLLAAKLITQDELAQALKSQKASGRKLGAELVASGLLTEVQMTQVLSNQLSVPWVSLYHVEFSRELLSLLPAQVAESCCAIPVYVRKVRRTGDTVFVAMDDPTNAQALQLLRDATGMPVKPMVAAPTEIQNAIRVYYFGGRPPTIAPPPAEAAEPARPAAAAPAVEDARTQVRPKLAAEDAQTGRAPEKRTAPEPKPAETAKPAEAEAKPEAKPAAKPAAKPRAGRSMTLTLLDGTTVQLPAPGSGATAGQADQSAMTTGDLISALLARAKGEDVGHVLPDDRWETLFATLLTLLLRKGLIADWEFMEEWQKRREE